MTSPILVNKPKPEKIDFDHINKIKYSNPKKRLNKSIGSIFNFHYGYVIAVMMTEGKKNSEIIQSLAEIGCKEDTTKEGIKIYHNWKNQKVKLKFLFFSVAIILIAPAYLLTSNNTIMGIIIWGLLMTCIIIGLIIKTTPKKFRRMLLNKMFKQ